MSNETDAQLSGIEMSRIRGRSCSPSFSLVA